MALAIKPLTLNSTAIGRRVHLLAWLLISLLFLTGTALFILLITNPLASTRSNGYILLILGLNVLMALAYIFNCSGYYSIAAGLTIACAIVGPWGSLMLDPKVLQGDFVPLAYTTLSVLLCGLLLSPLITIILAGAQLIALAILPFVSPATASLNWPSFLSFFSLLLFSAFSPITSAGVISFKLIAKRTNYHWVKHNFANCLITIT